MKPIDYSRPIAVWNGEDRILDSVLKTTTAIIRSGGCSWNRCLMCQYRHERIPQTQSEPLHELMGRQLSVLEEHVNSTEPDVVKLYTSGSFFDEEEVPVSVREKVAQIATDRWLVVECRADYISEESVSDFIALMEKGGNNSHLVIAIGLETSSDTIREKSIDKGILFEDYVEKTRQIHSAGGLVKTYLLQKPPYLSESESVEDMINSIKDISPHSDLFSLNPCTVQKKTYVERLWKQGAYRPPYLWSVAKVIAESDPHVTCDPIGGGQVRGPHNCGSCDRLILDAIRDYNLNNDKELIKSVMEMDCSCKEEWEFIMEQEHSWAMPLSR